MVLLAAAVGMGAGQAGGAAPAEAPMLMLRGVGR